MANKEGKTHAIALQNGNYKATGNFYISLNVKGAKGVLKDPSNTNMNASIMLGDFGAADPEVAKRTGQQLYNIRIVFYFGKDVTEYGVVSLDGCRITTKCLMGICEMEWITEEEAAALEEEGDPIDAPPGDYKIQPEYQGKLLWLTGGPGLGKSTSAQLLGRNHGYVYYEADCFAGVKNPYVPKDAESPTMAQVNQKPLKGKGLEKRREICTKGLDAIMETIAGKKFNVEDFMEFYSCMCQDIQRERKRIGGDWVVATVAFTKELRDHIRYG